MTTLRGSFCALHRLVERKLQRLCTVFRHPQLLHAVTLRKREHRAADRKVGDVSVASTPALAVGSISVGPIPVEEVERAPFGFEIPTEDDPAHLIHDAIRRGEQERAIIDVPHEEILAARHEERVPNSGQTVTAQALLQPLRHR